MGEEAVASLGVAGGGESAHSRLMRDAELRRPWTRECAAMLWVARMLAAFAGFVAMLLVLAYAGYGEYWVGVVADSGA